MFSVDFTMGPIALVPKFLSDCFQPDHCVTSYLFSLKITAEEVDVEVQLDRLE